MTHAKANAGQARPEVEILRGEVDAAWKAVDMPVRGWVTLAEIITDLKRQRDEAMQQLANAQDRIANAQNALGDGR